jgi:hypothetical protein
LLADLAPADAGFDDASRNGEPVLLDFVGDPGVGKSRLLGETGARATENGMQWFAARCLFYGPNLAYRRYCALAIPITSQVG